MATDVDEHNLEIVVGLCGEAVDECLQVFDWRMEDDGHDADERFHLVRPGLTDSTLVADVGHSCTMLLEPHVVTIIIGGMFGEITGAVDESVEHWRKNTGEASVLMFWLGLDAYGFVAVCDDD